jgi:exosortase
MSMLRSSHRILLVLVVVALIGVMYRTTLAEIVRICWTDDDYSHGLLLPFISAYVLWTRKEEIKAASRTHQDISFSLGGLVILLAGLALYTVGSVTNILFATWLSVFPVAVGALFLSFGSRCAMPFVMPLLLLFMAKPIPDSLVPKLFFPLQVFAAKVSALMLGALDVPVFLRGNIIEIPHMSLMVEEACSGIRSLLALFSVAFIVILLVPLRNWAKIFILGISVITAVALNVLRVALTGVLAHFGDPALATGFFHTFSGLIVFVVGLAIVYSIASLLGQGRKVDER